MAEKGKEEKEGTSYDKKPKPKEDSDKTPKPKQDSDQKSKPKHDMILEITGSFGKYQLWLCFIVFLSKFFIAFNQLAIVFYAPPVKYSCGDSNVEANVCPCDSPKYNYAIFSRTIVTEWNLICDRKWLASFMQLIFQSGTLVGSLGFGALSDRFGRRKPFIGACMMQCVFGITGAFLPGYTLFTIFRFIVGLSVGGTMVIGFVIIMEFIGPEYRETVSALYQIPFNLGNVLLPLISYIFRDFRHYHLAFSIPSLVFGIYLYSLPETPRWLIAKNRIEEAIPILAHTATMNNRPTENIRRNVEAYAAEAAKNKIATGTTFDLFRTPNLRKNILAMSFNWLMCSYCYYGIAQYVGQLSGNIFLNVAASSTLVTAGTFLSIPILKMFGRKTILLMCHFVCASVLIILAFTDGLLSVICASVGVVSAFVVFVVVYLYCGELFPTVVRNAAVGFSSMCARIGSMIAPFVVDLKDVKPWLAPLGFASVPFCAFFITMVLPETKGCELTTTIEEGEAFGKKGVEIKSQ